MGERPAQHQRDAENSHTSELHRVPEEEEHQQVDTPKAGASGELNGQGGQSEVSGRRNQLRPRGLRNQSTARLVGM